ncbi:SgcJ/EcaC family oxidoreductase [Amycolatopsis orientalis]|uniref:SgcJ/EcaC family oxidoreductase n=1 Tax=Amycolatopsis orientalis TaxID=31958 RepID=UPI00039C2161|nr:SgcJ/EcaC family oxidoreductase [Amycolatopsis orientalis]
MNALDTDVAAITAVLDRLVAAWDSADGAAYGAEFTADATYLTYVGTLYQGADEIGRAHQALFDSFLKGTRLFHEVLSIRHLGPDAAVVVTRGATGKVSKAAELNKVQTYSLVRTEAGWKVAAFQNTKRKPLMEAVSFKFQPASKPAA